MRRIRSAIAIAFLFGSSACAGSPTPSPKQPQPPLHGVIAIGAGALHLHCVGQGSPVVVFDAGFGDDGRVWQQVLPESARSTRCCVYDRLGVGYSSPAPRPHALPSMVAELRALLSRAQMSGPFVLVGHSLGGLNAQLYARRHPGEVAGLVLVDASSPQQADRMWSLLLPEQLRDFDRHLQQGPEGLDLATFRAGMAEVRAGAALRRDLPLAVLSAGKVQPQGGPPELDVKLTEVWLELQRELATASANSVQIVAPNSGHYLQYEQPALVVSAIAAVVRAARSGGRVELKAPPAAR